MYSVCDIAEIRKSALCMYCMDGVPLKNGEHDLFGVEKVPCREQAASRANFESEDISSIELFGITGEKERATDPTK